MPNRTPRLSAALAAATTAILPAAVSAAIVVAASGPSAGRFPPGSTLAESESVVLQEGDSLTVIQGSTARVLSGAGSHALTQEPGDRRAFAQLTARRSGSSRANDQDQPGPAPVPNLWYIDIDRPGTVCLPEVARANLWRKASDSDTTYVISAADRVATQTVRFAKGQHRASWNTRAMPIAPGAVYRLGDGDGVVVTEFSFVTLDPADEPEALARQLLEQGCTQQLELLAAELMPKS